jgi:DNA polymerase-3 subunit chi
MTRVDFYVMQSGTEQQRSVFACRLAEKAFGLGLGIYIHTSSSSTTARLDDLMWTFRDGSFLPHLPVDQSDDVDPERRTQILLGHRDAPEQCDGLLINLAQDVPLFFSRFDRVAEIVGGPDASRGGARERFRFYRDRGYPLSTHKL